MAASRSICPRNSRWQERVVNPDGRKIIERTNKQIHGARNETLFIYSGFGNFIIFPCCCDNIQQHTQKELSEIRRQIVGGIIWETWCTV